MRYFVLSMIAISACISLTACSSGGHYGSRDPQVNAYLRNGGLPMANPNKQKAQSAQKASRHAHHHAHHQQEMGQDPAVSASHQQ